MPKIVSLFAILVFLGCGVVSSPAEDVCALTVEVAGDDDGPRLAHVSVRDPASKVVAEADADAHGRARFCDLAFGDHTVEIKTPLCHTVLIDKVRFVYPDPLRLRVVLPLNSCFVKQGMGNACSVYFRIASEEGKPAGGATIKLDTNGFQQKADSYGRLRMLIPLAGAPVTVEGPRGQEARVRVDCEHHWYREQLITLRDSKARD